MTTPKPAIRYREVTKSFAGHTALVNASFDVPSGSVFGLLGPNGAGKTTLFAITAGFIRADSGSISILGRGHRNVARLRGRIGVLPQDASFQADLSILDQMVYLLRLAGRDHAQAVVEVARALDQVGLGDYLVRRTSELSHGMYKRLSLAQAFLGDPEVVLLDEPTAGLDPENAGRIRSLIKQFTATDSGRTVVVSSHDMAEMQELCTHVAILNKGHVVSVGSVAELCRDQRQSIVELAHPLAPADLALLLSEPRIRGIEIGPDGRMTIHSDGSDPAFDLFIQRWLLDHGAQIRQYQEGRSLADHFQAVTTSEPPARPWSHPSKIVRFSPKSLQDAKLRNNAMNLVLSIQFPQIEKKFQHIECELHAPTIVDTAIDQLHQIWNPDFFDSVQSPASLPRLNKGSICPKGACLLQISYISRRSGGMGSFYQFDGYFLSLVLIDECTKILDARGEQAS